MQWKVDICLRSQKFTSKICFVTSASKFLNFVSGYEAFVYKHAWLFGF